MSLITQCPACSTMFRVVPDQLRISEGWVRCGQCDEVFDANAHLRSLEEPAVVSDMQSGNALPTESACEVPAVEPSAPEEPHSLPDPLVAEPTAAYDWSPVVSPAEAVPADQAAVDVLGLVASDAPGLVADEASAYSLQADPFLEQSPLESVQEPLLVQDSVAPMGDWAAFQEPEISAPSHPDVEAEFIPSEAAPLSFMPPGEAQGSGRGKKVLFGVCALLALVLALQALVSERDRVAATAPVLRPLLARLCGMLACTIGPPRQIESIAIDNSAFTTVKPGVYLLHVTLKNAAAMDLATPALELTLTDAQDQPLLRRVLQSSEFNGQRPLAAGAELATSLPISVPPGSVPEKIAGYRLLAFYP